MRLIKLLPLILILAGCSINPPSDPNYYLLKSTVQKASSESSNLTISVTSVTIPEYLNRPQIVTRNNEAANFNILEFERWGENITEGISRVLSDNLMYSGIKSIPAKLGIPADYKLFVGVRRFEGTLNNQAELDAVWSVYSDTEDYPPQRSCYSVPSGETLKDLVEAQSILLSKLADDISRYVKSNTMQAKKKK